MPEGLLSVGILSIGDVFPAPVDGYAGFLLQWRQGG
jgi:hypothetical protein